MLLVGVQIGVAVVVDDGVYFMYVLKGKSETDIHVLKVITIYVCSMQMWLNFFEWFALFLIVEIKANPFLE